MHTSVLTDSRKACCRKSVFSLSPLFHKCIDYGKFYWVLFNFPQTTLWEMQDSENGKKETSLRYSNVESLPERFWEWQYLCSFMLAKEIFGILSRGKFVSVRIWSALGHLSTVWHIIWTNSLPPPSCWHCNWRGDSVSTLLPQPKAREGDNQSLIYFYQSFFPKNITCVIFFLMGKQ